MAESTSPAAPPSAETEAPCGRSLDTMHGHLVCVLTADHTEYHADADGLPFGPWRERVAPPVVSEGGA